MKNLANQIVAWLKNYAINANRKALVIGVSGGVDSGLVSTLCAETGLNTVGVILPCFSKQEETKRGIDHMNWLENRYPNILRKYLDLTNTFRAFYGSLQSDLHNDLAFANAKSRLRMVALYQIATVYGGLVVGTGNKVEDFGVGFFTKYGDGGVDISPIADLYKGEVTAMARILGVSEEICSAVHTDGLWDDARSDESQLGASYPELEWAMDFIEDDPDWFFHTQLLTNRQLEVLATYTKWHKAGAHKLAPIPSFKRV
jgi:NAD+ synthase